MVTFIVLAAALTLAGVLAVAVPLLRGRSGGGAPDAWAALGAAGLLIVGSALLYAAWSNWPWRAPAPGSTPQTMVAHLARQLEHGAARSAVGLPARGVAQKDLAELLELYAVKLRQRDGRDNHPRYVAETVGRLGVPGTVSGRSSGALRVTVTARAAASTRATTPRSP